MRWIWILPTCFALVVVACGDDAGSDNHAGGGGKSAGGGGSSASGGSGGGSGGGGGTGAGGAGGTGAVDGSAGSSGSGGSGGTAGTSGASGSAGTSSGGSAGSAGTAGSGGNAGAAGAGGSTDAGADSSTDAGTDGTAVDANTDSSSDAATNSCPALDAAAGDTIVFNGTNDFDKYPLEQTLTPGVTQQTWERFALTWDADYLYVTMVAIAFEDANKPVHVYVEAGSSLGAATPSTGKQYSGLTPNLPFTPTHLIAGRQQSNGYSGVYTPASSWGNQIAQFQDGVDVFVAADHHTVSMRVSRYLLGCPTTLRLVAHVVNATTGNEWKDVVPTSHTPWAANPNDYYEIDLDADPAISGWASK